MPRLFLLKFEIAVFRYTELVSRVSSAPGGMVIAMK